MTLETTTATPSSGNVQDKPEAPTMDCAASESRVPTETAALQEHTPRAAAVEVVKNTCEVKPSKEPASEPSNSDSSESDKTDSVSSSSDQDPKCSDAISIEQEAEQKHQGGKDLDEDAKSAMIKKLQPPAEIPSTRALVVESMDENKCAGANADLPVITEKRAHEESLSVPVTTDANDDHDGESPTKKRAIDKQAPSEQPIDAK